jgi:uncharacterized cupredoxin-like copper-binding protein
MTVEMRYALTVTVVALSMLAFLMFQSGPSASPVAAAPPQEVHVDLQEWKLAPAVISGGLGVTNFIFDAQNHGNIPHQLLIVKTDLDPGSLPVSKARVDVAKAGELIGQVGSDQLTPNAVVSVPLTLKPGTYVFICNIPGHYKQGMYASFRVE